MSEFKECPYCFEEILAKAIKCKHCHSMLTKPEENSSSNQHPPTPKPPNTSFSSHAGSSSDTSSNSNSKDLPNTSNFTTNTPPPPPPPPSSVPTSSSHQPPPPPTPKATTNNPPPPPPPGGNTTANQTGTPPPNSPGFGVEALPGGHAYDYPKANIGKRIIGYIVDGIISLIPFIVLIPIALMPIYRYIASDGWITPTGFEWLIGILGIIIGLGWIMIYTLIRDGLGNGQSIGKKIAGLKVVRLNDNKPCSKLDSLKRNIVAIGIGVILGWIPGINMITGFVEPIVAIIDKRGWRLGDRLAKTQVIMLDDYDR